MIFGESSFRAPRQGLPAKRGITRSKCPHCGKTISIPILRLRRPEAAPGLNRQRIAAETPLRLLAFE